MIRQQATGDALLDTLRSNKGLLRRILEEEDDEDRETAEDEDDREEVNEDGA